MKGSFNPQRVMSHRLRSGFDLQAGHSDVPRAAAISARSGDVVYIEILRLACVALGSGWDKLYWGCPPKDRTTAS